MQGGEPLSVRSSAKRVKRGTGPFSASSFPAVHCSARKRSSAIFALFANVGGATLTSLGTFSRQLFSRNRRFRKGGESQPPAEESVGWEHRFRNLFGRQS